MAYQYPANYGSPMQSNSIFTGDLDTDGTIYSIGMGRERLKVGVDNEKEQEYLQTISQIQETLDNYYNRLVELGEIKPQKTKEEIAQETAQEQMRLAQEQAAQQAEINMATIDTLTNLNQIIAQLSAEVKELKTNGVSGNVNGIGNEQSGHNQQDNGKTAKPSKSSASARTKAST